MSVKNNSIVLLAVASDYAKANPGTTASQLRQLFPMPPTDASRIIRSVKSPYPPTDAKTVEAAMNWAIELNAGHERISKQFGIGTNEARRIARAVKEILKVANKDKIERMEKARAYAMKNINVGCTEIAEKFGVSLPSLRRWHEENRARIVKSQRKQVAPVSSPTITTATVADRKRCKFCGRVAGQWVPVDRLPKEAEPDQFSYELV
jgi:hypothetical protein